MQLICKTHVSRILWKIPLVYSSSSRSFANLTREISSFFSVCSFSISSFARFSFSPSSSFLPPILVLAPPSSYLHTSLSPPSSLFSLSLTNWARYLLPAATAAKLKARTRVHFLRAAFYTVHYNARPCTHYTVRVIHYQPILRAAWENTETIIARDLWRARYASSFSR